MAHKNRLLVNLTEKNNILYYSLTWLVALSYSFFQITIIPFYLAKGFNFLQIGWFFLVYWLAVGIVNIPTGAIGDVHGRHVMFSLGCLAHVIAFIGFIIGQTFWHFCTFEVVWGVGVALQSDAIEGWIVEETKSVGKIEQKINIVFHYANIGRQILFAIGGVLGIFLNTYDIRLPWCFGIFFMSIAGILAYWCLKGKACIKISDIIRNEGVFKNLLDGVSYCLTSTVLLWLILIDALVMLSLQAPNTQWQPLFSKYFGMKMYNLSWVWILIVLSTATGSFLSVTILKNKNTGLNIFLGMISIAIPLLLVVVLKNGMYFALAFAIHEVGRGIFNPSFSAMFNGFIENPMRSTVLSTFGSISILFASLGGLIAGWIANVYGLSISWVISGSIVAIASCVFIVFMCCLKKRFGKSVYDGA